MKYSAPNISRRMRSGNISGSIGYWERCAAVARILWPTKADTSMQVLTLGSIWSPDGSDLVSWGCAWSPRPSKESGDARNVRLVTSSIATTCAFRGWPVAIPSSPMNSPGPDRSTTAT